MKKQHHTDLIHQPAVPGHKISTYDTSLCFRIIPEKWHVFTRIWELSVPYESVYIRKLKGPRTGPLSN